MKNSDLILAIETSGRTGSVAIGGSGGFLAGSSFSGYMKHSAELLPMIGEMLNRADAAVSDIRQVVITAGPGSFTGLRIAVTAAKMFHLALKTPIVALDSLDAIAENVDVYIEHKGRSANHVAVVLDAKKDYFFAAAYDRTPSGWRKYFETAMMTAEELLDKLAQKGDILMLGEGLLYHKNRFEAPFIHFLPSQWWPPQARNLFRLARLKAEANDFADPIALTPVYIRKPDAVVKTERP